ncbi:acyltransferase 3 [Calycina marina]|uniref:Acyltransferase 3 n=1 Tax=Calycina marina TaxID=1763456 RepID=A0A9P8CG68_9HELO|nr:acyltransferase 3 [Calycina marina]
MYDGEKESTAELFRQTRSNSSSDCSSYAYDDDSEKGILDKLISSSSSSFSHVVSSLKQRIQLAGYTGFPPLLERELHPTAWLDGVRGTAALFVVFHHTAHAWFTERAFAGYGSGGDGLNKHLIQLPIIRLIISGYPQVALFFVVSGYAISYKPMQLLHGGRSAEFLDSLGIAIITWMDWFRKGPGMCEPPHANNLFEQIYNWGVESINLAEPFATRDGVARYGPPYDPNLWTLPIEFRDSMILFGTLLGMCKVGTNIRTTLTVSVATYCLHKTHWDIMLFVSGMLMADLRFHRLAASSQTAPLSAPYDCNCCGYHSHASSSVFPSVLDVTTTMHKYRRIVTTAGFIFSLWLLGMPEFAPGAAETPGFRTFAYYVPTNHHQAGKVDLYWIPLGAVLLVFFVDHVFLQRVFETRLAQYLGKINFSLYMVHGPILYTLGWAMHARTVAYFGQDTERRYGMAAVGAYSVTFPVVLWVADWCGGSWM